MSGTMTQQAIEVMQERIRESGKRMDVNVKDRWLRALRSGDYKQTIGALQRLDRFDNKCVGHCCLGVLAETQGVPFRAGDPEQYDEAGVAYYQFERSDGREEFDNIWEDEGTLPNDFSEPLNIHGEALEVLMDMNDGGATFLEIADWIEEWL